MSFKCCYASGSVLAGMVTYGSCLPRILVREMKISQILPQNDYKATNLLNVRKKRYIMISMRCQGRLSEGQKV